MKVILHVGAGKTGSSALQAFFRDNCGNLEANGIAYPSSRDLLPGGKVILNHSTFFQTVTPDDFKRAQQIGLSWKKANAKKGISLVFISAEGLSPKYTEFVKQMCTVSNASLGVLFYVRRQDYYIESSWRQWGCKICGSVGEWIERVKKEKRCDWYHRLQPWKQTFNKESIIVRVYEKEQLVNSDIVDDVLDVLSVKNTSNFDRPAMEQSNPGFNLDVVEVFNICRHLLTDQNDNTLSNFFFHHLGPEWHKQKFEKTALLSNEQRIDIIRDYSASNKKVATEYLGRTSGELFFEPLPEDREKIVCYEGLNQREAIKILVELTLSMHKETQRQWGEIRELYRLIKQRK